MARQHKQANSNIIRKIWNPIKRSRLLDLIPLDHGRLGSSWPHRSTIPRGTDEHIALIYLRMVSQLLEATGDRHFIEAELLTLLSSVPRGKVLFCSSCALCRWYRSQTVDEDLEAIVQLLLVLLMERRRWWAGCRVFFLILSNTFVHSCSLTPTRFFVHTTQLFFFLHNVFLVSNQRPLGEFAPFCTISSSYV